MYSLYKTLAEWREAFILCQWLLRHVIVGQVGLVVQSRADPILKLEVKAGGCTGPHRKPDFLLVQLW